MNSNRIPSTIHNRDVKDSDDFESIMPKLLIAKKLNFKSKIVYIGKALGGSLILDNWAIY